MTVMGSRTEQVLSELDIYFAEAVELTRSTSVVGRSADDLMTYFRAMASGILNEWGEGERSSEMIQLEAGRALITAMLLDLSDGRGQHLRSVD
jgi:hypothetical protein